MTLSVAEANRWKRLAFIFLTLLIFFCLLSMLNGCGAGMSKTSIVPSTLPQPSQDQRDTATTPRIIFIGDDILAGLVAQAQNPLWACPDCAAQATSAQALANLPTALTNSPRPDLVIILTGSYDVDSPAWDNACGPTTPTTCQNIVAMGAILEKAGIPHLVCSIPFWQPGTLSDSLAPPGGVQFVQGSEDLFDHDFGEALAESDPGAGYLDMADAISAAMIGPDGIDPNSQGYAVMIAMIQAEAQKMHVGYLR
jgi:hypothetical protein